MKPPDSETPPACLLCDSANTCITDQFAYRDLRRLYLKTCNVDIDACIDQPYTGHSVYLYRCRDCGLELYPAALEGNARLYEALAKFEYYYGAEKWEFAAALQDAAGAANLLEVGCGSGAFLQRVTALIPGIAVTGLETSPAAVEKARRAGLDVRSTGIEEFAADHPGEFDRVCAFQVLEHVARPALFLQHCAQCLKPGGLLLLGVPNTEGFTRGAVNNFGDMPPHHLTHWTESVMANAAKQLGLKLEAVQREPVADYHKEWFRNTRTALAVSRAVGRKFRRLDMGWGYRLVLSFSHRLQKLAPSSFWKYDSHPGHTIYAVFRAGPSNEDRPHRNSR